MDRPLLVWMVDWQSDDPGLVAFQPVDAGVLRDAAGLPARSRSAFSSSATAWESFSTRAWRSAASASVRFRSTRSRGMSSHWLRSTL